MPARWALRNRRLRLCRLLFAGKMALQDVLRFEPLYDEGFLAPPLYIPPWVQRANGLAGTLAGVAFGILMARGMAGYIGGLLADVYGVAQRADRSTDIK